MNTIKIKYLLGTLAFGGISMISFINNERYGLAIAFIFAILTILSIILLISDRWTHAVTNEKGQLIAKFENEKDAMEFADNQSRNVRVLMLHIQ